MSFKRWKTRYAPLALTLLLLTSGLPAYASGSPTSAIYQSDDEGKAIEAALVELAARRREVEALRASVGARDDRIKVLEGIVADQTKLVELWRTAATERATANAADLAIQKSYEESVKRYEAELERVRAERDSARKQRWTVAALAFGLGAVLAVLATKD